MAERRYAPSEEVLDAATTLALYGRWWVKGIDEQARHDRVRRSIAADPYYSEQLISDAVQRAHSLGIEHLRIVHAASDLVRDHQEAKADA